MCCRLALPAALALLLAAALLPLPARACTSLLVGAGATDDGSSYIARNVDHPWSDLAHQVTFVPAQPQERLFHATLNGFTTTLPADGLAYWSLPPEGTLTFESSGVNSAGVAISATETIYPSADIEDIDPVLPNRGITEDSIPSVLLPQARSARQAIELLGALIEEQGAGEGFGVLAADQKEVWYLESAGAHHWMAKRLPNDSFLVAANQGRFQGANWTDPANVLYSEGLREFAEYWGLWDPAAARFSLVQSYMQQSRWDSIFNYPRVRELQLVLAGVDSPLPDPKAIMPPHPEFLRPSKPLSLFDVMAAMRNHYNGTDHDAYFKQNPREEWHPVAMTVTGLGHVTRVRPASANLPPGLRVIQYVGLGTPAWVPYIPIYSGLSASDLPLALVGARGRRPDPVTLWWKGRRLVALMFRNWPLIGPGVEARLAQFDRDVEASRGPMEDRYIAAWQAGNQAAADAELAAFTAQVVTDAGRVLDELAAGAVQALALPGMPDDKQLQAWLNEATLNYQLDPLGSSTTPNPFRVEW